MAVGGAAKIPPDFSIQPCPVLWRGDRLVISPPLRKSFPDDLHFEMEKVLSIAQQMC